MSYKPTTLSIFLPFFYSLSLSFILSFFSLPSRSFTPSPSLIIIKMWSALLLLAPVASAQVTATGPNGPTNPDAPYFYPLGSYVNQQSDSRLVTINGIDDWCMYAPMNPGPDSTIGNHEHDVVAWCTKPRNGAR
jgi:hypothetical protein